MPKSRAACFLLGTILIGSTQAGDIDPTRQAELKNLLYQDCGSCHGMRLTGGLGPPLRQSDLSTRDRAYLQQVISQGIAGTPMPPWSGILSGDDIHWLVDYLKQGNQS